MTTEAKTPGQMLAEPFHSQDIEWRIGTTGKNAKGVWALCFPYLTARAVMNRLDDVFGAYWQNKLEPVPGGKAGGFICGLSVKVGDEWITRWDGAEVTDVEPLKGAISAALKRAAVLFGIGRYLYDLPDCWAIITDARDGFYGKTKDGTEFRWYPPGLPKWALPGGEAAPDPRQSAAPAAATAEAPHGAPPVDDQRAAIIAEIETVEAELPAGVGANLRKRVGGDLTKASLGQLKALLNAYRDQDIAHD
jgi:hypothetical protein